MGNSAEKFGFKVGIAGDEQKKPCNLQIMTLERVNNFIDNKKFDAKLSVELKKLAARYPQQALENFIQNFNTHLLNARKTIRLSKPTTTILPELGEDKVEKELNNAPKINEFE
jgi:hypothetical protein